MEEQFIISMFGLVFMTVLVVMSFGSLTVEIVLGRPAGLAFLHTTGRVAFEVVAAGGIAGISWQAAKLLIPSNHLQKIAWALAAVAAIAWVFVAVRNSEFFKDFPGGAPRQEGELAPRARDQDRQP